MNPCTDCTAAPDPDTRLLTHDAGCPVGADTEATSRDDAEWFDARPGATERYRRPSWSEQVMLAGLLRAPHGACWHGHITVRQLAPGVRVRDYSNVYAHAPRPEGVRS